MPASGFIKGDQSDPNEYSSLRFEHWDGIVVDADVSVFHG